ncbi:acetyl-CoA carboxylase, carboxyltransferase subunit beta [Hyphococcus luteus]|uniref:Acetyl-coenzyme A carboxylase carboxyl transferase subunit beta n=1 Tax=Hyphococcus luteus TaxID=2058213 RepID=A0A2S7K7I8_9PROT|nr:acetyl-CoA carboxylase, carboxyltransferase subunit beta [Marinicaulis flavus]PQA88451.1 acetyl-CoA carboxylase carboxyl transferase subunit beta [Marinicaulis flavus]
MSWLSNIPPGIKNIFKPKDDSSDTLWSKCPGCGEMIFQRDLDAAHQVCPSCDHHLALAPSERLALLYDDGAYEEIELPDPVTDPLKFRDEKKYADRLKENRRKTGQQDAMRAAYGTVDGVGVVAAIQNFKFMGGSMGMALGEAMLKAAEVAVEKRAPLVVFAASGGARMQEGILSLMQMPRTTIAVQMVKEAGLPYIVFLTNPTTGGVTASYAMLGDVNLAEPGALIGFAGPRVIEQTIREKLPEGFQRAEFLLEKGMVDMVVSRADMKSTLSKLIRLLIKERRQAAAALPAAADTHKPEAAPNANKKPAAKTKDAKKAPPLDKAAE